MNNITSEMFNSIYMYLQRTDIIIKKIKVTSKFAEYIKNNCYPVCLDLNDGSGVIATFTGTPIEIDDTIKSEYYELVYQRRTSHVIRS